MDGFFMPFFLGIVYGFSVCCWSCLPYIGSYIIGEQRGGFPGIKVILLFNLGKLISYALLGALAGYLGSAASQAAGGEYLGPLAAVLIIWLGGSLIFKSKSSCPGGGKKILKADNNFKLALLGFTVGLIPCLPLNGILLYAAAANSVWRGCLNTVLFGIGTTLSPLLLMGGILGWFSKKLAEKIPQYKSSFQIICGFTLIFSGVKLLLGLL